MFRFVRRSSLSHRSFHFIVCFRCSRRYRTSSMEARIQGPFGTQLCVCVQVQRSRGRHQFAIAAGKRPGSLASESGETTCHISTLRVFLPMRLWRQVLHIRHGDLGRFFSDNTDFSFRGAFWASPLCPVFDVNHDRHGTMAWVTFPVHTFSGGSKIPPTLQGQSPCNG
jgi:hypothetical protein